MPCRCGKDQTLVPCYVLNYPAALADALMTDEEKEMKANYKCKRICNANKGCRKHKCKEVCCPVRAVAADELGLHLCMKVCGKMLQCKKHECGDFCHIGNCKPCKVYANQPLFCPCGTAKIDPPVLCGTQQPTCDRPCQKVQPCGHRCTLRCHLGSCPPCLEIVDKTCNCGSTMISQVHCSSLRSSCGKMCGKELACGHLCQKVCHKVGGCGDVCGQKCGKQRANCAHRCMAPCHPGKECPDEACTAEIRVFCACGHRWVLAQCRASAEKETATLECNAACMKH